MVLDGPDFRACSAAADPGGNAEPGLDDDDTFDSRWLAQVVPQLRLIARAAAVLAALLTLAELWGVLDGGPPGLPPPTATHRSACLAACALLAAALAASLQPRRPRWSAPRLSHAATAVTVAYSGLMAIAATHTQGPPTQLLVLLGGLAAGQLGVSHLAGEDADPLGRGGTRGRYGRPRGGRPLHALAAWLRVWAPCAAVGLSYLAAVARSPRGVTVGDGLTGVLYSLLAQSGVRTVRVQKRSWAAHVGALRSLRREEENNDAVLSLLLPREVMDGMKGGNKESVCFAEEHPEASVLFVEIANFSAVMAAGATPAATVELLNAVFWDLDECVAAAGLLKVETVGPVYVVAAGIPAFRADHCAVLGALALRMRDRLRPYKCGRGKPLEALFGLHTGPVIGGVVGVKLPRYRLFGDTINTAARFQTHSLPGEVHLSAAAADHVRAALSSSPAEYGHLEVVTRGEVVIKSKGTVLTFWLRTRSDWAAVAPPAAARSGGGTPGPASGAGTGGYLTPAADGGPDGLDAADAPAAAAAAWRTNLRLVLDVAGGVPTAPGESDAGAGPVPARLVPPPSVPLRPTPRSPAAPPRRLAPTPAPSQGHIGVQPAENAPATPPQPRFGRTASDAVLGQSAAAAVASNDHRGSADASPAEWRLGDTPHGPSPPRRPSLCGSGHSGRSGRGTVPSLKLAHALAWRPRKASTPSAAAAAAAATPAGHSAADGRPPHRPSHRRRRHGTALSLDLTCLPTTHGLGTHPSRLSAAAVAPTRPAVPWSGPISAAEARTHLRALARSFAADWAPRKRRWLAMATAAAAAATGAAGVDACAKGDALAATTRAPHAADLARRLQSLLDADIAARAAAASPAAVAARRSSLSWLLRAGGSGDGEGADGSGGGEEGEAVASGDGGRERAKITWRAAVSLVGRGRGAKPVVGRPPLAPAAAATPTPAVPTAPRPPPPPAIIPAPADAAESPLTVLRQPTPPSDPPSLEGCSPPAAAVPLPPPLLPLPALKPLAIRVASKPPPPPPPQPMGSPPPVSVALSQSLSSADGWALRRTAQRLAAEAAVPGSPRRFSLVRHRASVADGRDVAGSGGNSVAASPAAPPGFSAGASPMSYGAGGMYAAEPGSPFAHPIRTSGWPMSPHASCGAWGDNSATAPGGSLRPLGPRSRMPAVPRVSLASPLAPPSAWSTPRAPSPLQPGTPACVPPPPTVESAPPAAGGADAMAALEENIRQDSVYLTFAADESEAAFLAKRFTDKRAVAVTNARAAAIAAAAIALGHAVAAPHAGPAKWVAALGLAGGAALSAWAYAGAVEAFVDSLQRGGLTLARVRHFQAAGYAGAVAASAVVVAWAAVMGQAGTATGMLGTVLLAAKSMNGYVFDARSAGLGTATLLACHWAMLVVCWVVGTIRGAPWETLLAAPALAAAVLAQRYGAIWGHYRRTRRDFVLQAIAQHRRNISAYLISNMLPAEVIAEIRRSKRTSVDVRKSDAHLLAWSFPIVHVLQSDIVGFTKLGARVPPEDLCRMLHDLFSEFDDICETHGVYKVETVGDAYICATGCVPSPGARSAPRQDAYRLARVAAAMAAHCAGFRAPDGTLLQMRIGLATGSALGGVVGATMLRYHLFGDLMGEVTCFEQHCPPGGVLCSAGFRDHALDSAAAATAATGSSNSSSFAIGGSFSSAREPRHDSTSSLGRKDSVVRFSEEAAKAPTTVEEEEADAWRFGFDPAPDVLGAGAPRRAFLVTFAA